MERKYHLLANGAIIKGCIYTKICISDIKHLSKTQLISQNPD